MSQRNLLCWDTTYLIDWYLGTISYPVDVKLIRFRTQFNVSETNRPRKDRISKQNIFSSPEFFFKFYLTASNKNLVCYFGRYGRIWFGQPSTSKICQYRISVLQICLFFNQCPYLYFVIASPPSVLLIMPTDKSGVGSTVIYILGQISVLVVFLMILHGDRYS